MTEDQKKYIDNMTYTEMLSLWRFGKSENPLVQGECGKYLGERMSREKTRIGSEEHTRVSKEIGW
jgi:hypothetical protein